MSTFRQGYHVAINSSNLIHPLKYCFLSLSLALPLDQSILHYLSQELNSWMPDNYITNAFIHLDVETIRTTKMGTLVQILQSIITIISHLRESDMIVAIGNLESYSWEMVSNIEHFNRILYQDKILILKRNFFSIFFVFKRIFEQEIFFLSNWEIWKKTANHICKTIKYFFEQQQW